MNKKSDRMKILDQLEKGEISPSEAAEALERDPEAILSELDSPMKILEAIESGKISADEAAAELGNKKAEEAIHFADVAEIAEPMEAKKAKAPKRPDIFAEDEKVKFSTNTVWTYFIAFGTLQMALSAFWMNSRITSGAGLDFWFFFAWIPFLLGLFVLVVGWVSKVRPWVRINVRSKTKSEVVKMAFGFPLPKRMIKWGFMRFGNENDGVQSFDVDTIMDKMEHGISDEPIAIYVDDDDDDVEILIG